MLFFCDCFTKSVIFFHNWLTNFAIFSHNWLMNWFYKIPYKRSNFQKLKNIIRRRIASLGTNLSGKIPYSLLKKLLLKTWNLWKYFIFVKMKGLNHKKIKPSFVSFSITVAKQCLQVRRDITNYFVVLSFLVIRLILFLEFVIYSMWRLPFENKLSIFFPKPNKNYLNLMDIILATTP